MKAAVLKNSGDANAFQLEERPIPQASEDTILIKVKAFGLNRSELMTRKGYSPNVKFPRVLGIECVGEVESDPSGDYQKGQKVAALMGGMGRDFDGSYAEYTVLPKSIVFPFESQLSWDQLGAIPEMYQTVYGSLSLALNCQKGDNLLIRGGTSSIGMLATQLAKSMGVQVIATTRNPDKASLLMNNGVSYCLIDDGELASKVKAIFPDGVDKVLELVGTVTLKDSLHCAKPGGTVCMTGMLAEQWEIPNFAPMDFIPPLVSLTIYNSGAANIIPAIFQDFIHTVEAGQIHLNVSKVFHLDEIAKAHAYMESNQAGGKLVVLT
ncbi:zinc-binding alcohol dehydrogenase family protein [Spirosoma endophyticum]|uniref:NADPH:quinone reductase n=1 Tax=Spirosoma endophyticum TaxID=662367 RepID=A0A1I2D9G2_9BACT|nr:zinc-binding alcohol dehydrogenase family protein [Spirosoma endophyticum]SFE77176.1 NADPH:quinone reductase [Spirosoma endophyticum]